MGTYGQLLIHSNRHLHIGQTTAPCHSPRPVEFSLHHNKPTNLFVFKTFFWLQIRDCSAPPRRGYPPGVQAYAGGIVAVRASTQRPRFPRMTTVDYMNNLLLKTDYKARPTRPYRFLEPTPPRGRRHRSRSKSRLRG